MARTDKQGGGKSWIFWGAGLLVVILVVVVGLLTLPTGSNEAEESDEGLVAEGPDPSSEPVEPEEEEPTETEGDASTQCEDMEADSGFPTEAPAFEWEDFEGVEDFALPVSDEHGPAVQEDGFWRCFSQTAAGAAFAAPSLYASFTLAGHYEAALDSPGARAALPSDLDFEQENVEALMRGFRIVDSNDEEATVEMWVAAPDGSVDGLFTFVLVWDDEANDWKLDLAGGEPQIEQIENTSDYTEWR